MTELASRVNIVQGEYHVSGEANVVIATLLGSCVAACLHDPVARVGGMNHFLLPGDLDSGEAGRYGVHLMELLVNGLLKLGASRDRLEAKLFGGANTMRMLGNIGDQNATFAREFLARERITVCGGSLGGTRGRRLQYFPYTGNAKQMMVAPDIVRDIDTATPRLPAASGDLQLF
jgi:chemotaxis protein CheD